MKIYFFLLFFCVLGFTAHAQKDCPLGKEYAPTCSVPGKFDDCQNGYKKMPPKKDGSVVCKCLLEIQKEKDEASKKAKARKLEVERRLKAEKAKAPYSPPAPKDSDLTAPETVTKKSGTKVDTFTPTDPYNGVDLRKKELPKKPEPTVTAGEDDVKKETKKDSVPPPDSIPKYYKIGLGPFVEAKILSNNNSLYGSNKLLAISLGLTLKSKFIDGPAKGLELSFSPSYSFISKQKRIVDNSESILPLPDTIKSVRGVLLQACVSYRFLGFGKLFIEGGYSPTNKELPGQGIGGGLGLFYEPRNLDFEFELFGGVGYSHSLEYFGGLRVSYNFWFNPKP